MKSKRKDDCNWIFTKHDKVKFNEINKSLKIYSTKNNSNNEKSIKSNKKNNYEIWFKQQPLILHVACRDLESAIKLLETARKIFRRAGIIGVTSKKVMIEIIGSEHLETIVSDRNFVIDEKYLKQLIKYANMNFGDNLRNIHIFLKIITNL